MGVRQAFDEMLLLKRGGEVIYNGPLGFQSQSMVAYFEAIPGVQPISETANPATWMLEISTISAEQRIHADLAALYRRSKLARCCCPTFHCLNHMILSQNLQWISTYSMKCACSYIGKWHSIIWGFQACKEKDVLCDLSCTRTWSEHCSNSRSTI